MIRRTFRVLGDMFTFAFVIWAVVRMWQLRHDPQFNLRTEWPALLIGGSVGLGGAAYWRFGGPYKKLVREMENKRSRESEHRDIAT